MSEPKCSNCGSADVELVSEQEIKTGDGTPVLAKSIDCRVCHWLSVVNEVRGPIPDQPGRQL